MVENASASEIVTTILSYVVEYSLKNESLNMSVKIESVINAFLIQVST